MLRMASSDGLDARGKGCHDISSEMLEWRRENLLLTLKAYLRALKVVLMHDGLTAELNRQK